MVNKVLPFKDIRIKNNTQDWFNDELVEAIKLREKSLIQFKSIKLHIDDNLSKEAKYHAFIPYNLSFLFNFVPGFVLCNVGEICAMLAQHFHQPVIIKKLTSSKEELPKCDVVQTTMH